MPRLSVVLPVLNEASLLPAALAALTEQAPDAELVVVDGGSDDGTQAAARAAAHVLVKSPRAGRGFQMDLGLRAARGRVVLFLHPDTRLPAGWPALVSDAFAALPTPAWAAFRLAFDDPGPAFRLIERGAAWRQALTGVPHADQGIAVDREAALAAGGVPHVPLMEEYELARRMRGQGRFVPIPAAAITSPRRYGRLGPLGTAARNSALVALWHLGVSPSRIEKLYR